MSSDLGRLGLDSLDGYSGTNYPFLLPTIVREFVEDIQLTSDLDDSSPISLVSIAGVGQAAAVGFVVPKVNVVDLQFGRADGSIPIDTRTMSLSVTDWAGDTKIYVWSGGDTVVQAVISHRAELASAYQITDGVLDDRVVIFRPEPVTDIQVLDITDQQYKTIVHNRVGKALAGYNVQFDSQTTLSEGLRVEELTISAKPGSGLGRHPPCPANFGITELGTARPDSVGNLLLSGRDCITVRPKVSFSLYGATVNDGEFEVLDQCKPRCQIEDFTSAANYVTRQWNKFVALAKRIDELRNTYHNIIGVYADAYECMTNNPIRGVVFSAKPCAMVLNINVYNPYCKPLRNAVVKAKITDALDVQLGTLDAEGAFTTKYENGVPITLQTTVSENGGEYVVQLYPLPGGKLSSTYIRVLLDEGGCSPAGKATIELSGNLNLDFNDLQPVTFEFDLANA